MALNSNTLLPKNSKDPVSCIDDISKLGQKGTLYVILNKNFEFEY